MRILLLPLILLTCSVFAEELTRYHVIDHEQAVRLRFKDGPKMFCLLTTFGSGFTLSDKWVGFTCTPEGETAWRFCRGLADQGILECIPPGSDPEPYR